MKDTRTISLAGSNELYWDDIDEYAQKHGFKTTSGFIQYLAEKEILGIKTKIKDKITYILLLVILGMLTLMLTLTTVR